MYWIKNGGALMYFIILMSVLGTGVIIERFIYFKVAEKRRFNDLRDDIEKYLEDGNMEGVIEYLDKTKCSTGKVLKEIFRSCNKNTKSIIVLEEKAREQALAQIPRLERNMWILSMVAHVTPLVGLLGTVTGMIKAFQAVAIHGTGDASILAEGISEALFTTAGGLFVAIPALIIYNYYNKKIDDIVNDMEKGSVEVINYFRR
ncbi:MotA/TolQ/ExbB proton channel family protein [Fusobacterium sp. MFO224]|uniref:MotA/TolQ/ExbB proton channel family protein n=1 Tax=Fusobacterium sp. MFO224 TaxID=3378070 RepID=UPI003851A1A1